MAALIGKGSLYHAYHPYTEKIEQREIVLPKGHNVDYGTPVEVMVAQGGGQVVEAGYANMCSPEHVEMMISEKTAAILYIKSHHTVSHVKATVMKALKRNTTSNLNLFYQCKLAWCTMQSTLEKWTSS